MSSIELSLDHSPPDVSKETLSHRLNHVLHYRGYTQVQLARKIGVTPQVIQYLCTSGATKSKFTHDIAEALNVSSRWLVTGKGPMTLAPSGRAMVCEVPMIDWYQISDWIDNHHPIDVQRAIPASITLDERSFALSVEEDDMSPRFEPGTILIIDPTLTPETNDYVVVQTAEQHKPLLRQLRSRNNSLVLVPNNLQYKEVKLGSADRLLGVLRQIVYEFHGMK